MAASDNAPYIAPQIVEWISKIFPMVLPSVDDSDRSIWITVGSQKVVRKMKQISDEQAQNIFKQ